LWEIGQIPAEKLVFVDEAGVHLGMTPTYARALVGQRVYAESVNRGTNISLVGAVRLDGVNALYPYDGAVDGERFLLFLKEQLIPTLKIGDVVVMDNLRVHHIEPVKIMIEEANARLLYLPPYHPELNPIEEAWSKIKNIFRKVEARTISALVDALEHARNAVSKDDLLGYFKHAGYDPSW
jgi:transposase